jgi:hypothetical protein
MSRLRMWAVGGGSAVAACIAIACGGSNKEAPPKTVTTAPGGSHDFTKWPKDDRSLCEAFVGWHEKPELEVEETVGPGSLRPNVRRISRWAGEGENRKRVLICREIDTNLDGLKDVVRTFDEKTGEARHEEADTDYDGIIDDKVDFVKGRIAKEEADTKHSSTPGIWKPDVWKYFVDGNLSRIKRNAHCSNGKPDTWEIYRDGRLERIGNDATCDGHIDRWDRDTELLHEQEAAELALSDAGTAGGDAAQVQDLPSMWYGSGGDGGAKAATDGGKKTKPRGTH